MITRNWQRREWALPAARLAAEQISGLRRWFRYAGLGWIDSADAFHCCPGERVRRRLPRVFLDDNRLEGQAFVRRLASACPELDGGEVFHRVHSGATEGTFSAGLAQALIDLHLSGVLQLDCPQDSRGWSLSKAEPPVEPASGLRTARVDFVSWKGGKPAT